MAITFLEERKVQRRYVLIFLLLILIAGWVVWRNLFVKEQQQVFPAGVLEQAKKIELDFKILDNPILQELWLFEEIKTYEEEISGGEAIEKVGRENPFVPY